MALIPNALRPARHGWRGNEPDPRDWDEQRLGLRSSGLPDDLMHMVGLQTILDQPGNSCTGHGLVQCMAVAERMAYKRAHPSASDADVVARFPIGSPLFPYYVGRALEHRGDETKISDVGAYPRLVIKGAATHGIPDYDIWAPRMPFHTEVSDGKGGMVRKIVLPQNRKPSAQAWIRSNKKRRPSFYWVKGTGAERVLAVRAALAADKPVGFGTGVDSKLGSSSGPHIVDRPATVSGLHFMSIIGSRRAPDDVVQRLGLEPGSYLFTVAQSYGRSYRNGGLFEITERYLTWQLTGDLVIVHQWEALDEARAA